MESKQQGIASKSKLITKKPKPDKKKKPATAGKDKLRTYCIGWRFEYKETITTRTIANIIDKLHELFGPNYGFAPEPITEGGIEWIRWPNKQPDHYKTCRLHCYHERGADGGWPLIHGGKEDMKDWHNRDEAIWKIRERPWYLFDTETKKVAEGATFLKAFGDAPVWTKHEIDLFVEAFQCAGWRVVQCSIPKKRDLSTDTVSC